MEITHPFHPLRGRRFRLLKRWRHGGRQFLILEKASSDTFAIQESWTSEGRRPTGDTERLAPEVVLGLLEVLDILKADPGEGLDKGAEGC